MRARPSSDLALHGQAPWRRWRRPRSLLRYAAWLGLLVFVVYAIDYLDIDLDRLLAMPGRVATTLAHRYFPPNIPHILEKGYLHSVLETLEMSYLAAVVGILLAVPASWFASWNMTPSRRFLYPVARLVIMAARSVHEMVWTILFVAILGYGMLAGTLALCLFCLGFTGKLFAEAIEAIDAGQVEAIRATGANNFQVFVFAVLPQVRVAWTGISIYTWDALFRAATVVGFVGAGGIGWYLRESTDTVAWHNVAAILLSILVLVIASELISAWLRARVARAIA